MREWTTREVKEQSRANYKKNILYAVVVCLIIGLLNGDYTGITGIIKDLSDGLETQLSGTLLVALLAGAIGSSIAYTVLRFLIGNVVYVGGMRYFLRVRKEKKVGLEPLLSGFRDGQWKNLMLVMLVKEIKVFLWSLLLVIPGVIKQYEYAMVPYILAEHPNMDYKTALETSSKMMDGEKFNLFWLYLSFIGWDLLCALTAGIGNIFLEPYVQGAVAEVYIILKDKAREKGLMI